MTYYIRAPGENEFRGPSSLEEIRQQLVAGSLQHDFEALPATGQTYWQLKQAVGWIPLSQLLPGTIPIARSTTSATHYFVLVGTERRGPFIMSQIQAMWHSGAITADARLEWEGSEPVPIAAALQQTPRITSGSQSSATWRIALTLVGGVVGLLASYFFRPKIFGIGPSLGEWLTEGLQSQFATTIIVCVLIGVVLGFVAGLAIDVNRAARERMP